CRTGCCCPSHCRVPCTLYGTCTSQPERNSGTMSLGMRQRSSDPRDATEGEHRQEDHDGEASPSASSVFNYFNIPPPILLLSTSWLHVPDLLTLGKVNRSFQELTKEEILWKTAARHLWRSALVDGQDSLVEGATNIGLHALHAQSPADLTMRDICRCMVGAWPTHIDRNWRADVLLQASIDGVLQPLPNTGHGDTAAAGAAAEPSAHQGSNHKPGLCNGVVFRGRIGDDRAVRANLPFPWLGTVCQRSSFLTPTKAELSRGCMLSVRMLNPAVTGVKSVRYPDALLARVKAEAPFSWLWPGHAAAGEGRGGESALANGVSATAAAATGAGAAGAGAAGAASGGGGGRSRNYGNGGGSAEGDKDRLHEVSRLPSSGSAPFFHAGYTAYFEITLGDPVAPLGQAQGAFFSADQCVAIGLANDSFPLVGHQPGWDRNSWGFHSDDGRFYHRCGVDSQNSTTFGPGDTVGCGLLYPSGLALYRRRVSGTPWPADSTNGAIFFTKNGRFLGTVFENVSVERPLYPCIGLDSHCCVTANFGSKAFAFDVPAFEAFFAGAAHGCSVPGRPHHAKDIRGVYAAKNGFVNPRLLYPYVRMTVSEESVLRECHAFALDMSRGGTSREGDLLASQSEILRHSLRLAGGGDDESSSSSSMGIWDYEDEDEEEEEYGEEEDEEGPDVWGP
ncbi:unnamed protein product, partial [Scytosiphon promiscuus]